MRISQKTNSIRFGRDVNFPRVPAWRFMRMRELVRTYS
ncbi:hypothetical protein BURCENK562V_C3696 [Burkholderia cenocepacia K56-2Valvano]|nr:hypothetical protein BURCENK562V_C3696 [Burkholderia cenocepacia K56-2Valvano]